MTESQPIAAAALDALLDATGGDPAFLGEMIDAYLADSAELFDAMDGALAGERPDDLQRAAHSLKSNSATFGALVLADICRQIEERAKAGEIEDLASSIETARAEYGRVQPVLDAARAEL